MRQHIKKLSAYRNLRVIGIIYIILVTILLLIPTYDLPSSHMANLDKLVHFSIHTILAFIGLLYLFSRKNGGLSIFEISVVLFICLFYGIIIELLQYCFTITRHADILDVAANFCGSILGFLVFLTVKKYFKA